jgi:hypothetical protein
MSDEQERDEKRDRGGVATLVIYGVTCAAIIGIYIWYSRRADQRMAGLTNLAAASKPCGCHEAADLTSTGEDTGTPPARRDANGRFIKTAAGDDGNG